VWEEAARQARLKVAAIEASQSAARAERLAAMAEGLRAPPPFDPQASTLDHIHIRPLSPLPLAIATDPFFFHYTFHYFLNICIKKYNSSILFQIITPLPPFLLLLPALLLFLALPFHSSCDVSPSVL